MKSNFRIILIFLFLLLPYLSLKSQSSQQLKVLLYNGQQDKSPLQGVSVSAVNAGSTISDETGIVKLQFRSLKLGDPIQFRRIEMSGYEVMNTEVVENMHIGTGELTIVMCNSDELARLRDGYRSLAAQRYQKQLTEAQKQVDSLQKEGKIKAEEFNQRMETLETEYQHKMQSLDTYVDKFARIDLSELDTFEQEIISLVQEGRFEEAIGRYEEQHLTARLQEGVKQQKQLQGDQQRLNESIEAKENEANRLEKNLDEQIKMLHQLGGEENLRKAEELEKSKSN